MLHRPSFLHALWSHAAITLVMIVAAICAGPALGMLLGAMPAVVLLVAALCLVRFAYSEIVARGMLDRRAPLRRVFANVLPGAFLGTADGHPAVHRLRAPPGAASGPAALRRAGDRRGHRGHRRSGRLSLGDADSPPCVNR